MGLVDKDGLLLTTPLSSVRNVSSLEKIDWVAAIFQSCNPNGFGDLLVTLKDPTGTIDASIHRRISEGEFSRDISVGAVLILQKVAVFSPSRSASYLNITLNNVVKIINKDSGPSVEQDNDVLTVNRVDPDTDSRQKPDQMQKVLPPSQRGTEGIMSNLMQMKKATLCADNEKELETERGNSAPVTTSQPNGSSTHQTAVVCNDTLSVRQDVTSSIGLEVNNVEDDQEVMMDDATSNAAGYNTGKGSPSDSRVSIGAAVDSVEAPIITRDIGVNCDEEKKQYLRPRGSLPEWTDEQLEELLDFD